MHHRLFIYLFFVFRLSIVDVCLSIYYGFFLYFFLLSFPSNKEHQVKTRKNILMFAVYLNSSYYSDLFFYRI